MYNADASIYKYIYRNVLINTRHGCSEYMLENTTKNQKKKKRTEKLHGKNQNNGQLSVVQRARHKLCFQFAREA